jgi:HTH-type transcriptional regulator / antitoxin HigA
MDLPDPVEAIKFRMEQRGVTRRELEKVLGRKSRVSEVLNRKRTLTLPMIRGLTKKLDIPAELLVREYKLRLAKSGPKKSSSRRGHRAD